MIRILICLAMLWPAAALAQDAPLRIEITEGVIRPMPLALRLEGAPPEMIADIARVVAADLDGTGLFAVSLGEGGPQTSFDEATDYASWKATETEALVTGRVEVAEDRVSVSFRLFDVFAGQQLGDGMQFEAPKEGWRRAAHKVADQIYARVTGEAPYFDSRLAFVGESGSPTSRVKRLGVMDYDGAGVKWLTGTDDLVLSPRFAPDGQTLLFTSFRSGQPQIISLDIDTVRGSQVTSDPRAMSFAPRFSPDGGWIVFSRETGGNTDIWLMQVGHPDFAKPLTLGPAIDTAPSFSPDGQHIVFESDRSGSSQLYVMRADGSEPARISFSADDAAYGEPAWSPRGDLIAFTRHLDGGSVIGVMRPDGSAERLLSADETDFAPSWAPGGRVVAFTRLTGTPAVPKLHMVDISGNNMREIGFNESASSPAWGPLLP